VPQGLRAPASDDAAGGAGEAGGRWRDIPFLGDSPPSEDVRWLPLSEILDGKRWGIGLRFWRRSQKMGAVVEGADMGPGLGFRV
jgi:hypothetical protein